MLDNDNNLCPERKTALIARELARYNIDITAISETHLAGCGELCEQLGGYTYFWSGKPETERASSGVGFAIWNSLARSMQDLPKGISDRIITLRLPLATGKHLHLISVYAPTLPSSDEVKLSFYQDLRNVLRHIPPQDRIVLLGDFNARVGSEYSAWEGILGRHGVGKCNENGLDLLTLCAEFDLCFTNTFFRLPEKYKTSWMHPRSKHWHLLDYVIVRKKHLSDVLITRAMRGAEGWTDHRLIRSKLRISLKFPRRANHKKSAKLAFSNLTHSGELRKTFDDNFGASVPDIADAPIDDSWLTYSKHLRESAERTLGKPPKKNQDWFDACDADVKALLEKYRHSLRNPGTDAKTVRHLFKSKVRELKDRWWAEKAAAIQHYADTNQTG